MAGCAEALHRLLCTRSHNLGLISPVLQKLLSRALRMRNRGDTLAERVVWDTPLWGFWLKRKILVLTVPTSDFDKFAPSRPEMFAELYVWAGTRHEARGQVALALQMWDRAGPPHDIRVDSHASQTMLRKPDATSGMLAAFQKKWVERHIANPTKIDPGTLRTSMVGRKVESDTTARSNSDTIRFICATSWLHTIEASSKFMVMSFNHDISRRRCARSHKPGEPCVNGRYGMPRRLRQFGSQRPDRRLG